MRLDFVVPGFSKCGTTTLCRLLGEHPEIFIPDSKEPAFFAHRWQMGWDAYGRLFAPAAPHQLCGEGSTFYSNEEFSDHACRTILKSFPEVKFIFITRNPLKRIESSFREMHHSGHEYAIQAEYSLGGALRQFPNMILDTLYWARVNDYRRYVPDQRIHALFLEELERQPEVELRKCFEFLGVDPDFCPPNKDRRLNSANDKFYDAPLYRLIRNTRSTRFLWKLLPPPMQQRLCTMLKLRRRFADPVHWDPETLHWVLEQIEDDATAYLEWAGAPAGYWELRPTADAPQPTTSGSGSSRSGRRP